MAVANLNDIDKIIGSWEILKDTEEPTEEDLNSQEHFVSLEAWDSFKCGRCKRISNMFSCKSSGGSLICSHCGSLN